MSTSAETPAPPRITKRKLDEVISALDDAVNATAERPTPAKHALNPARVAAAGWHCPPASQFSFSLPSVSTPGTPKSAKIVSLPGTPESSSKGESASSTSGMDRLHCAICKVSWTVAPTRGMTRDAANALTERQAKMLVEKHKDLCPWRKQQCDLSIYRIPLKTPLQTARDIVKAAKAMDEPMSNVEVAHPLMPDQLKRALHILKNVPLSDTDPSPEDVARPSTPALLAALFGWELAPAPRPPPPRRISSTFSSWSRASSRASTPAPDSPTPAKRTDAMLHCLPTCTLCQRRVGLWTQRALNVAREHRVYCPYVARTAVLPTLPSTASTALVEGWRARAWACCYGRGTVDSMDVDATGEEVNEPEEEEELARVQGMVRAVKAAAGGGGEVRKYVRSLLEQGCT
ncbi:hypothetical protein EXIGLDRAFT_732640 [Exidia glandulosa HHB12029]|uniref:Zf-C3HC-domain-containing protein n=1 Tax=Exidia glandulosa HHB12029 TaxID=1314781 RepID=A0A165KN75_EXIGL|nr:hypothetical protein EXIGLDRAFT_732640 [Exidia glandulosa HHB12029]